MTDIVQQQANGASLEDDKKMKEAYQGFLQKSCEIGQIIFNIKQIETQKTEMEKQLDKATREQNKAASDHRELQKLSLSKLKTAEHGDNH